MAFDTSGTVIVKTDDPQYVGERWVRWEDLSPFQQGYVEALFASARVGSGLLDRHGVLGLGFSDLAPSCLARIMADCDAVQAKWPSWSGRAMAGKDFWEERNDTRLGRDGQWGVLGFPPLTAILREDGKVDLREAG